MRVEGPINQWREAVGRSVLRLDFAPADERPARLRYDLLLSSDGALVTRFRHSPGASFRDRALIRDDRRESWTLLLPFGGSLHVAQRGAAIEVKAREATLLHNVEEGSVGSGSGCDYLAVILPERRLAGFGLDENALVGRKLGRGSQALQLLRSYASCLARLHFAGASAAGDSAMRHIVELIAQAALPGEGAAPPREGAAAQSARLAQALAYIQAHHADPQLSAESVAASQKISPRYLHRIFELSGLSLSAYLRELRLQRVHRELADPQFAALSIAEIAFRAGFSDVSHFNRAFRQRFDMTPSGVRTERKPQGERNGRSNALAFDRGKLRQNNDSRAAYRRSINSD